MWIYKFFFKLILERLIFGCFHENLRVCKKSFNSSSMIWYHTSTTLNIGHMRAVFIGGRYPSNIYVLNTPRSKRCHCATNPIMDHRSYWEAVWKWFWIEWKPKASTDKFWSCMMTTAADTTEIVVHLNDKKLTTKLMVVSSWVHIEDHGDWIGLIKLKNDVL